MKTDNKTIGVQQIFAIALLGALTPFTRFLITLSAGYAGRAGWLVPIFSTLYVAVIICCMAALFKKESPNAPTGLAEMYEKIFGHFIGKALLALYFLWLSFHFICQIRYYSERMVSTVFPGTDFRFFIAAMMILVFIVIRGSVVSFGRFSEAMLIVFVVILALFFLLLLPSANYTWALPITKNDIKPVMRGTFHTVSIYTFMTYFFFISDSVSGKNELMVKGKKTILFTAIMPTIIVFFTIAVLGHELIKSLPLPFFTSLKIVTFIQPFDRLEAIMLSAWVIADFVTIAGFALAITRIVKQIFSLKVTKYCAAPISLIGFVGGNFVSPTLFKMTEFSTSIEIAVISAILGIGVPVAAVLAGKVRKIL